MISAAVNERLHEAIMDAQKRRREFAASGEERLAEYWRGVSEGLRNARRIMGERE